MALHQGDPGAEARGDSDAARRSVGAESDYYAGLGVPYGPRNTVPTSLEELLSDYQGTLLLVSHDRDFLDRTVTRTLAFEGDGRFFLSDPLAVFRLWV